MRITILNRIRHEKVRYREVIDHDLHDVLYIDAPFTLEKVAATKPDQIVALSEFDLLIAAEFRDELSLPGPGLEDTLLVRDKVLMKQAVSSAKILCPRSCRLNEAKLSHFKFPVVLKPVDGASSEGVEICFSQKEYFEHLQTLTSEQRDFYEIEEYISGPILHFDGWVQNGNIIDFIPSRYVGTCYDFLKGLPLGSYQIKAPDDDMKIWSEKVARAVGIKSGPFHLEAILSRDGLCFLEIAHRVGGAGVAPTFEMKTGINLYHTHLATQLGLEFESRKKDEKNMYGWFVFPGHHLPTPFCSIYGIENVSRIPGIFNLVSLNEGEKLPVHPRMTYQAFQTPVSGLVRIPVSEDPRRILEAVFSEVLISGVDESVVFDFREPRQLTRC